VLTYGFLVVEYPLSEYDEIGRHKLLCPVLEIVQ